MTEDEKRAAVGRLFEKKKRPRPEKWPRAALRELVASVEYYGEPKDWPEGFVELAQLALKGEPKPG